MFWDSVTFECEKTRRVRELLYRVGKGGGVGSQPLRHDMAAD